MKTINYFLSAVLLLVSCELGFAQITSNRAGKLDATFAGQGYVDLNVPGRMSFGLDGLAKTPDNRIIASTATFQNGTFRPALHRVLPTGEIDQTFAQKGHSIIEAVPEGRTAPALAVQPDGKILVAGYKGSSSTGPWVVDAYVVRLNADATLDTSFGNNGVVEQDLSLPNEASHDRYEAIVVKPDGKILLVGLSDRFVSSNRTRTYVTLTQLNANGSLDGLFGQNGVSMVEVAIADGVLQGGLLKIRTLRSNKIAVLTSYKAYDSIGSQTFQYLTTVIRFESNGQPDLSFGNKGKRSYSTGQFISIPCGFDEDESGNLYLITTNNSLRKLNPNGEPDANFGFAGVVSVGFWTQKDLRITSDGKITVIGSDGDPFSTSPNQFKSTIRRYNSDGSPDIKFGRRGSAYFVLHADTEFRKLLVDDDGSLFVAGIRWPESGPTAFVARVFGSHKL